MQNLIDKYKLVPHSEGGYYAVVYESKQSVTSPVVNKNRKAVTHIYFLSYSRRRVSSIVGTEFLDSCIRRNDGLYRHELSACSFRPLRA